jgi:hypothetical protein
MVGTRVVVKSLAAAALLIGGGNATAMAQGTGGAVGGSVPATLSLTLGTAPGFGAFQPGVARDYLASTTATITTTANDAQLYVADSGPNPGHLMNGTFMLQQPLQVAAGSGGAFFPISASPLWIYAYNAPKTNDVIPIQFKQSIGSTEGLRTGTYTKSITFTLSTTNP